MKKDIYIYPALFDYAEDGITITFPDLPGCITCATNDEEAFFMAKDALGGHMVVIEEGNDIIPIPTKLNNINLNKNQRAVLIQVDMPVIRDAINNKSVRKTLTIPQWLNTIAEREGVNFSYILQRALKEYLRINIK